MRFELYINLVIKDKSHVENTFDPKNDTIYICGSISTFGNWELNKAVEMKLIEVKQQSQQTQSQEFSNFVWSTSVKLDLNLIAKQFEYKYFIARKSSNKQHPIFLKQIELKNRVFKITSNMSYSLTLNDVWRFNEPSNTKQLEPVVDGWLLNDQIEFQLSFLDKPLKLLNSSNLNVDLSDLNLEIRPYKCTNDGKFELISEYLSNSVVSCTL